MGLIVSFFSDFRVPEGPVESQIEAVEMFIFGTTTPKTEEDRVPVAQSAAARKASVADAAPAQAQSQAQSQPASQPPSQPHTPVKGGSSAPAALASPAPAGAVAMSSQSSHNSTEASSEEGSHGHGHGHFFKLGSGLRKHTGSVSIPYFSNSKSPPPTHNPPDHEASSRHVPAPRGD